MIGEPGLPWVATSTNRFLRGALGIARVDRRELVVRVAVRFALPDVLRADVTGREWCSLDPAYWTGSLTTSRQALAAGAGALAGKSL